MTFPVQAASQELGAFRELEAFQELPSCPAASASLPDHQTAALHAASAASPVVLAIASAPFPVQDRSAGSLETSPASAADVAFPFRAASAACSVAAAAAFHLEVQLVRNSASHQVQLTSEAYPSVMAGDAAAGADDEEASYPDRQTDCRP